MRLNDRRIAVVGGDEREQEIARLAALTGAEVTGYGFPRPVDGIEGVAYADSAAEAMRAANYALFPIPGIDSDGALFAPHAVTPIMPDRALLGELATGAHIILGSADNRLREVAAAVGVRLHEYESDRELMLLRAPAIVEGALQIAIDRTDITIHSAHVLVIGYGAIGALLGRTLTALGARVRVAARNPEQRAEAYAAAAEPFDLAELEVAATGVTMLFATVPAWVVGEEVLTRLERPALVMDLAAPPGGVDLQFAAAIGHRAVWARGLGARAPITVGASQWSGILRRIEAIEEARA